MKEWNPQEMIDHIYPHPSAYPPISLEERAAQFAPFAALSGHDSAIKETARLTDAQKTVDEDILQQWNEIFCHWKEGEPLTLSVSYFCPDSQKEGGHYETYNGRLKTIEGKMLVFEEGRRVDLERVVACCRLNQ